MNPRWYHLFSALVAFERNLIRERTNAGLATACSYGRVGGRPPFEPKKLGGIVFAFAGQSTWIDGGNGRGDDEVKAERAESK